MKRAQPRGEIAPSQKRARPFRGQAGLLRRLEYAAHYALTSKHQLGPFVAKELSRIAELIVRDGKGVPSTVAALQVLAGPAVDIERDTGAPVAKHLAAVIRVYTKPPKPPEILSPAQWARRTHFLRMLRTPMTSMRRGKRPPE
jgi:hypothetical protein